jgi:hypothetical protein
MSEYHLGHVPWVVGVSESTPLSNALKINFVGANRHSQQTLIVYFYENLLRRGGVAQAKIIQIVRPALHHLPSCWQVRPLGMCLALIFGDSFNEQIHAAAIGIFVAVAGCFWFYLPNESIS